jgi:3-methyl-2-oxobutanoate hydroxymethyltransferase
MDSKITIAELAEAKRRGKKIAAVSCYDYTTAKLAGLAGVEMLLVGDSAAQAMLGFDTTLPATMDFMVAITAAVRRAAPNVCLVADMPFLSYHTTVSRAVENAGRFFTDCGVQMVKIEASAAYIDCIKAVSNAGMAVMAHIGIRPQSINKVGRLRAEATTAQEAQQLICLADRLVEAGADTFLLEGTAAEVCEIITKRYQLPVIGCGSGSACDGQILIAPDILGLTTDKPKFAKSYASLAEKTVGAFSQYAKDVKGKKFPDNQHSYHMKQGELKQLLKMLKDMG